MAILESKLSRAIFIAGIVVSFYVIHFTSALDRGGIKFSEIFTTFIHKPWVMLIYLGFLILPALVASIVIPWSIRWIKSGK